MEEEYTINTLNKNYSTENIYKYFCFHNVRYYHHTPNKPNTTTTIKGTLINNKYYELYELYQNKCKNYYLILDFSNSHVFFHFIMETVAYFEFFKILKIKIPSLKIKMPSIYREYYKLIGKYYDIMEDDFTYEFDKNSNNICIFILNETILNCDIINDNFYLLFNNIVNKLNIIKYKKTNDILILTRQTKDNYLPRSTNITDIINKLPEKK